MFTFLLSEAEILTIRCHEQDDCNCLKSSTLTKCIRSSKTNILISKSAMRRTDLFLTRNLTFLSAIPIKTLALSTVYDEFSVKLKHIEQKLLESKEEEKDKILKEILNS